MSDKIAQKLIVFQLKKLLFQSYENNEKNNVLNQAKRLVESN